ncbi:MAG TPA: LamG-like jellyroll fold domain-containing protein, partial [Verrucomicrobiae bacterium]
MTFYLQPWLRYWRRHTLSVMASLGAWVLGMQTAPGANIMNYGADGNDYFQFTTPSLAYAKASGFTTLITFAMHVDADGTLEIGGGPVCQNGVYVGPANWGKLITDLKSAPTTVNRYEVCIGGWLDTSYDNIKTLIQAQGAGPGSILYRNFQALKAAVPGIDAINDDDEKTYDPASTLGLANLLGGLGFRFTLAPYTQQAFWVTVNTGATNCDAIYLQCYAGGAGNDPAQWNAAFGPGVKVIPGQESNTANPAQFRTWYQSTGAPGGFYYPDVVFAHTGWSAAVIQANGLVPASPAGLSSTVVGGKIRLAWNVVPGAMSYNIKRANRSGNELTITNLATSAATWPAANLFWDNLPATGNTNYYKVSAVNTNGESLNSAELAVTAASPVAWFKADAVVGLIDGAALTTWPDSTGHGYTATQPNSSLQPVYRTGGINGLPVVQFPAGAARALLLNRPVQDDFTCYCVFRPAVGSGTGNSATNCAVFLDGLPSGTTNGFNLGLLADGRLIASVGDPNFPITTSAAYNDGLTHILTLRRISNTGWWDMFVDGQLAGGNWGPTNTLNAAGTLTLGASAGLAAGFRGDIAELKLYGTTMGDTERVLQEQGLAQKWGVLLSTAGLLAWETFNYPPNSILTGQVGGSGWSNGWVDVSGTANDTVTTGSLMGGNTLPPGLAGRSAGNAALIGNASRSGRWLDCSASGPFGQAGLVNGAGKIGAAGKTLYLSFLLQPNAAIRFYELEFHR